MSQENDCDKDWLTFGKTGKDNFVHLNFEGIRFLLNNCWMLQTFVKAAVLCGTQILQAESTHWQIHFQWHSPSYSHFAHFRGHAFAKVPSVCVYLQVNHPCMNFTSMVCEKTNRILVHAQKYLSVKTHCTRPACFECLCWNYLHVCTSFSVYVFHEMLCIRIGKLLLLLLGFKYRNARTLGVFCMFVFMCPEIGTFAQLLR